MNIILTLDYELYFGKQTGSVKQSIVKATDKLLSVLDVYNIKAVFFVDIGFLKRLQEVKTGISQLEEDYTLLTNHLKRLSQDGHDLQLHIHPHWKNSTYQNGSWNIDTEKYRLGQWSEKEIHEIISSYKSLLSGFCTQNHVFAYRAGGWCIQPFNKIKKALMDNEVWLDSTVYQGGFQNDDTHFFDFRNAPDLPKWRFEEDPLQVDESGYFMEIPIASFKVSPLFFWKLAFTKLWKNQVHNTFGDGVPLPASKKWVLNKMLFPSSTVISLDGYKASFLQKELEFHQKKGSTKELVIIGHPKALSEYSLDKLDEFISKNNKEHNFHTFSSLLDQGFIKK